MSNLMLWSEAGYFDAAGETKPLLHLWSLGIEEQFYLIWPLILYFSSKKKWNSLYITLVIFFISISLNIAGVSHNPIGAFYSPQTRFWELLAGSLLAWCHLHAKQLSLNLSSKKTGITHFVSSTLPSKAITNAGSFFGFFILLFGLFRINQSLAFPGKWAIVPVLGATLLIASGKNATINRTLLANRFAVWFGLISFPLYLWHWPLLTFARILQGETPSSAIRLLALLFAIFLAWLTYRFIERPVRTQKKQKIVMKLALLMVLTASIGLLVERLDGIPKRPYNQRYASYIDSIRRTPLEATCFDIPYGYKNSPWYCTLGNSRKAPEFFAYGDSHSLSMLPALEKFAKDEHTEILYTGASGCPPLLGIQSMRGELNIEKFNCRLLNERIFDYVKSNKIKNVVLIGRWTYYTGTTLHPEELNPISRNSDSKANRKTSTQDFIWSVKNTVQRYQDIEVNVIFVEDNPQQDATPSSIIRKGNGNDTDYLPYSIKRTQHTEQQKFVNNILETYGKNIVNTDNLLCNEKYCPLVRNKKFLYFDDDHLSITGSEQTYPALAHELIKFK